MDSYFVQILIVAVLFGGTCGLLSVYIVGLRLPFVGIFVSHTAMVGAVYSTLLGLSGSWPCILFSGLVSMSLAWIRPHRQRLNPTVAMAVLFSFMLGLTFLGFGLIQHSRTEVMSLLWGNILFVRSETIRQVVGAGLLCVLFAFVFDKELKALLFSRTLAGATGIHEGVVYTLFLFLCGVTLAIHLPLVGGLMIFCLITNPAAGAYQICKDFRTVVIASVVFGIVSTVAGFLLSYRFNLPTGACIVLVSTAIFAVCVGCKKMS